MRNSVLLIALFIILLSCGNNSDEGPGEIFYGEDTCERCRMIISEKKFAAQYTTPDGVAKKFDDLGCMLEHIIESEKHELNKLALYIVDYRTGKWIDARTSSYVITDSVITPMGHGILAFRTRESAGEFARDNDDRVLGSFEKLNDFISGEIGSE